MWCDDATREEIAPVPQMRVWGCFVTRSFDWKCWRRRFSILDFYKQRNTNTNNIMRKWKQSDFPNVAPPYSLLQIPLINSRTFLCYFPPEFLTVGKCWCFPAYLCLSVRTLVGQNSGLQFSEIFQWEIISNTFWDWTELSEACNPSWLCPVCLRLKAAGISPLAFTEDWGGSSSSCSFYWSVSPGHWTLMVNIRNKYLRRQRWPEVWCRVSGCL